MKKTLIFLVILALAVPTAAMAAAEFSLGGYIKLDAFWDSSQEGKNMNGPIARSNDPNFHHGRLKFTSQSSRFNFTIKGPKLFGATTTGFIEMDFDSAEEGVANIARSASAAYTPRLRHAMFRFNWPETELMLGQYFSMFSEYWSELAQDGPLQMTGTPTHRLAQIRVTQKFAGAWTVAALVGEPQFTIDNRSFSGVDRNGSESGEMPQIQGKVQYEADLWGKAAYYGKPRGFSAQITAGVGRTDFGGNVQGAQAFGEDGFNAGNVNVSNRYLYHWLTMGSLFIPVIPTHSANLAGTASLMGNWWIGQGVEAFGFTGTTASILHFSGTDNIWDQELVKRFGGFVQAQYYFNNQWFLTGVWGMSRVFGISPGQTHSNSPAPGDRSFALLAPGQAARDQMNYHHEFALCLWYRPIQALKFGMQYAYARTNWLQNREVTAGQRNDISKFGDAHRVEFVGFFYF